MLMRKVMRSPKIRIVLALIIVGLLILIGLVYPQEILGKLDDLKTLAQAYPLLAPLLFISIYIAATILVFIPVSFLTLLGGWLFGPIIGSICNFTGALMGAVLAFSIARYLARDWVASHIGERLKMIRDGVSRAGWRFVAIVRLAPVLPFNILNGALGLTDIRFKEYVLATAIFILPVKIAYTYVGSLGLSFIINPQQNNLIKIVIGCGALIVLVSLPWIIKYFRKARNV